MVRAKAPSCKQNHYFDTQENQTFGRGCPTNLRKQSLCSIFGPLSKSGVTEGGLFAFACQYSVTPHSRTRNRIVTQMRHPLLVEGLPNCARQSLASTISAPHVAATSYCHPGRHANVVTPCLLTPCSNVPYIVGKVFDTFNFCDML